MSKENIKGLVPKLRFPEFRDAGEWIEKQLGKISDVRDGTHDSPKFHATGKPLITSKNLRKDGTLDLENVSLISEEDYIQINKRSIVGLGDILFGMIGTIGNPVMVQSDGFAIKNVALIKQQDELLNSYLVQLLNSGYIAQKFDALNAGNTQKFIALGKIRSLEIPVPEKLEQQKIADCLSSLDELIAAHTKKFEALQSWKKGSMQNLFPAEGKTVPTLRFPEFEDSGEWVNPLIEDFFNVGSSKRVLQKDWKTHGVSFYRTRELVSLSKGEPFSSEIFISEELYSNLSEKYGIPREGDFLVSGVGTLGISYQVQPDDKFYFKDGNVLWLAKKGGINSTYFKYCFESEWIQNQIIGQTSKSTVGTYTIQNAKKTSFWSPPSPEEQQKIADCLSSIDELITAQAQKIENLKAHKKGLMQQLFPATEGGG